MMKQTLHKKLFYGILFFSLFITNAQTISLDLNGVTDINLEGFTANSATATTTTSVIVTLDDIGTPLTGNMFLTVYLPTGARSNANSVYSINLNAANATSQTPGGSGNTISTWNIDFVTPRTAGGTGMPPTVGTDYRMQVRAFASSGLATNANSNIELIDIVSNPTLSIDDINNSKNVISIYPNPVTDIITIKNNRVTKTYKIVNIIGTLVKEVPATNNKINVFDLQKGIYFLITDAGNISKFIKI